MKQNNMKLPPNIIESDTVVDYENRVPYDERPEHLPYNLTFYLVKHTPRSHREVVPSQWIMTTLSINNKGRAYGIGLTDKKMYTVGNGPHVQKIVNVYFSTKNWRRLQEYVELYMLGAGFANQIRDRRSSRAAQTRAYKAALYDSMRWDS